MKYKVTISKKDIRKDKPDIYTHIIEAPSIRSARAQAYKRWDKSLSFYVLGRVLSVEKVDDKDSQNSLHMEDIKESRNMIKETTVNGKKYIFYPDFNKRCMYAEDEEGNKKVIYSGGYISNDLSVRKAIASVFGLPTSRRNAVKETDDPGKMNDKNTKQIKDYNEDELRAEYCAMRKEYNAHHDYMTYDEFNEFMDKLSDMLVRAKELGIDLKKGKNKK